MKTYSRTIHPNGTLFLEVNGGVVIYYPDNTRRYVSNNWYNDISEYTESAERYARRVISLAKIILSKSTLKNKFL